MTLHYGMLVKRHKPVRAGDGILEENGWLVLEAGYYRKVCEAAQMAWRRGHTWERKTEEKEVLEVAMG